MVKVSCDYFKRGFVVNFWTILLEESVTTVYVQNACSRGSFKTRKQEDYACSEVNCQYNNVSEMSDIVKLPKNYLSLVIGSTDTELHYSALLVCLLTFVL